MDRNSFESLVLAALLAAALAVPAAASAFGQDYLVSVVSRLMIFAIAAISLDFILGYGGMVSLGHAAFFGVGAYTVGILAFHMQEGAPLLGFPGSTNALLTVPLAMLVSGAAALAIGALCLRTSGIYFIMITLAFGQMLYFIAVSLHRYGGDDGLTMWEANRLGTLDLGRDRTLYFVALAALTGFLVLCRVIVRSRFGRALAGIRQNPARMRTLGYGTTAYQLTAFTFAGAGAGLAGALIANHAKFVSPDMMHWTRSGEFLVMIILGGMGTLTGAIFGAAVFMMLEELLPQLFDALSWPLLKDHWRIVFGPLLIIVILTNQRGIFGVLVPDRRSPE